MRTAPGFLWSLWLSLGLPAQAPGPRSTDIQSVHYQLQLAPGNQHVTVAMRVCGLQRDRLTVRMPAWKPGSHRIQDFGRAVRNVTAADANGRELQVAKAEGPSWSVGAAGQQQVTIHYQLPLGDGAGPRRSVPIPVEGKEAPGQVIYHEAYVFDGPATWMYVPDRRDVEQRVTFKLPEGWNVATSMTPTDEPGVFTGKDYDVMADCPFHIGTFETLHFELAGVPYRIMLSGCTAQRKQRVAIVERTKRIATAQLQMMGKAPFSDYTFLIACIPALAAPGPEHVSAGANCTNIRVPGIVAATQSHDARFDTLLSRQFFHLWNGKRLRPRALDVLDYIRPNRTCFLWFTEGITSYYGDLCCVRAGILAEHHYWTRSLPAKINKLQSNAGRKKISVAETSWTAWDHSLPDRAWQRDAPDYYNKGELLGLLLDVKIRDAADGKGSLDDVMRGLYKQCMDADTGFADGDVRRWCERVAGTSFEQFFNDYVDGTEELPFGKELSKIGLDAGPVERRPAKDDDHGLPARHRPRGRQRPPSWRVQFDDKATERALRLRADMTRRIKN